MNRKSRVDMTGMYKRLFVIGLLTFCYVQMLAAQNPHSSWLIRDIGVITEVIGFPYEKSAADTLPEMQLGFIGQQLVYIAFSDYSEINPVISYQSSGQSWNTLEGTGRRILARESGTNIRLPLDKANSVVLVGEDADFLFAQFLRYGEITVRQETELAGIKIQFESSYDSNDFPTYLQERYGSRADEGADQ